MVSTTRQAEKVFVFDFYQCSISLIIQCNAAFHDVLVSKNVEKTVVFCFCHSYTLRRFKFYGVKVSSQENRRTPKNAHVIVSMMNDLGIREYDPQVLSQLLALNYSKYLAIEFFYMFCLRHGSHLQ